MAPSFALLALLPGALAVGPSVFLPRAAAGTVKSCSNPVLSCHNTSAVTDTCCTNSPGGQLLQTQFWDAGSDSTGPTNHWTLHGLWPDNCDGTYVENCDSSRDYTGISSILTSFGKTDLLNDMNTYWKNLGGTDEELWEHEWSTHGTCISTLDTKCYTNYASKQEIPDFFQTTMDLFQTLDSYAALSKAGIVPSSTATYTSAAILAALKAMFGKNVIIQCSGSDLDQVYYSFEVLGSVQTGTFEPIDPVGETSNCPASGVKYLPKTGSPVTSTATGTATKTTTATSTSAPTGTFSGSGFLEAYVSGSQNGCLISGGTWYTSGTCATYTASSSGTGFTLKTSKGSCGVSSGTFTCGSGVTASTFTSVGGLLAYNNKTTFFASAVASGSTQEAVSTSSGAVSLTFEWSAQ